MDRLLSAGWVAGLLLGVGAAPASASVIAATTPVASCSTGFGTVSNCADTVFYSTMPADDTTSFISGSVAGQNPLTVDFVTAFNNWNANTGGSAWTLVNGGSLNLTLTYSVAASVISGGGGISPVLVNISNYVQAAGGPSLAQLGWTQGLLTDYTPTGGLSRSPVVTLDTYSLSASPSSSIGAFKAACTAIPGAPNAANNTTPSTIGAAPSGTAYCDPIYPFQYYNTYNGQTVANTALNTDFFYDAPAAPWLTGAFRGVSLLSTVTYDTDSTGAVTGRVLTVYQGIDYGFDLSTAAAANDTRTVAELAVVPEPGAVGLFGAGLAALLVVGRRGVRAMAREAVG